MFMGLSSLFVTWLFVILVLVAGRHLSKVITGISASITGTKIAVVRMYVAHLPQFSLTRDLTDFFIEMFLLVFINS